MIKKFHATTTREALRLVRDALGANAIILSNRQVAGGVEIIAVADLDMAALSSQAEPAQLPLAPPTGPPAVTSLMEHLAQREASLIHPVRPEPEREVVEPPPPAVDEPRPAEVTAPVTTATTKEQTPSPAPAQPPPNGSQEPPGAMQELVREMRMLRGMVEGQLAGFAWGETARRDPVRAEAMKRLLAAGFSTALSRQLLDNLPAEADTDKAVRWLRAAIAHNVKIAGQGDDILEQGGVYAVVGPTGVGKTTTVAKLAARAVLRYGAQKVALVTTDTYRIGAQDQLRIYGRILGTPVFAVRDENDLEMTLSDLGRRHLVFIDTVGMSQRDKRVAEQIAFLCGEERGVKRLLLLGAPAQGVTLEEVARSYSGQGLVGCILTKIDEALSYGPALDVAIRHQLMLHYVTNGQRVPEDLHAANALYLVDRAFRLSQSNSPFTPDEGDYPVLMAALDAAAVPQEDAVPGVLGAAG
jgi:flagellar biosynthesis protein FlhF